MPPTKSRPRRTDVEAKVAELAALRKTKGKKPLHRFVAGLRDPDLPVAKTAAMGLCDRRAMLEPLRELLADPDPAMRWRACSLAWFFMIKDFAPDLARALRDPDRMVRAEAAWAMRSADSDAAARALLKAAGDKPSGVLVLPYFTPSGTPYFDMQTKGAILGLRFTTTRGEIIRALLEAEEYIMIIATQR